MGSCPVTFLWLWPVTDHETRCPRVLINKIWRRAEPTPQSGWWRSHMAGIYSKYSTHISDVLQQWLITMLLIAQVLFCNMHINSGQFVSFCEAVTVLSLNCGIVQFCVIMWHSVCSCELVPVCWYHCALSCLCVVSHWVIGYGNAFLF